MTFSFRHLSQLRGRERVFRSVCVGQPFVLSSVWMDILGQMSWPLAM